MQVSDHIDRDQSSSTRSCQSSHGAETPCYLGEQVLWRVMRRRLDEMLASFVMRWVTRSTRVVCRHLRDDARHRRSTKQQGDCLGWTRRYRRWGQVTCGPAGGPSGKSWDESVRVVLMTRPWGVEYPLRRAIIAASRATLAQSTARRVETAVE